VGVGHNWLPAHPIMMAHRPQRAPDPNKMVMALIVLLSKAGTSPRAIIGPACMPNQTAMYAQDRT